MKIKTRASQGRTNTNKAPTASMQREFSEQIAKDTGLDPRLVRFVLSKSFYKIGHYLKSGTEFKLKGIGAFQYRKKHRVPQILKRHYDAHRSKPDKQRT